MSRLAPITDHNQLTRQAYEMRLAVMQMLQAAGSGHAAGPLSMADIFTYLYFNYLKHDPANPTWQGRDYFLVSNGHICPIWYAVLAHTGYFPLSDLASLRKLGSHLQGHPKNLTTPGVFNSSGPLGHGEGQAIGVALGLKLDGKPNRVYCVMSDGEQQEGAVWESMLVASKYQLNNLTFILDRNGIQIDGPVAEIMPLPDLKQIYTTSGFKVREIDGHNFTEIAQALAQTEPQVSTQPNLIIANTTAGKGVSFMEGSFKYHDWRGGQQEAKQAVAELTAKLAQMSS